MAHAVRVSCASFETRPHADATHVTDDAGLGGQARQRSGKERRVLLQNLVARQIGAGDAALRDDELDARDIGGDGLGCGVVLAAVSDDEIGFRRREAA